MGIVIAAVVGLLVLLAAAGVTVYMVREPGRRVRRKDLAAAHSTVNAIDDLVDRYHPQLDTVGQALAAEIRQTISKHRQPDSEVADRYFEAVKHDGQTGYWRSRADGLLGNQVQYLWPDGTWHGSFMFPTEASLLRSFAGSVWREITAGEVPS